MFLLGVKFDIDKKLLQYDKHKLYMNKFKLFFGQKMVLVAIIGSLVTVGGVSAVVIRSLSTINSGADSTAQVGASSTLPAGSSNTPSSNTSVKPSTNKSGTSTGNANNSTSGKPATSQTTNKTQSSSGSGQTSSGSSSTSSSPPATSPPASGGFQANCINVPSACGYPDATNTGVPAGVSLTSSGSITVTQDGAVVQNMLVNGQIVVRANNVTIKDTRIISGDYYPIDYSASGLLVQDSEIIGTSGDVTAGMSFSDYTARRVEITGTSDGFKADANVLIEDCYVHGLYVSASSHNDGVQTTGGSNVRLNHNTFKLGDQDGINAIVQFGTEGSQNSNWTITNNLLDGGGWMFNNGNDVPGSTVTNNRFTHRYGYGIGWVSDTAPWTGNIFDDTGAVANPT